MNENFEIVIGLEVHAELNTESKIFCSCKNEFGAEPNTRCCPVCAGMPGTLPVLNQQVVESAIKMGHALHCEINNVTKSDRKNYFYPDLPKAYQISQFDVPLCGKGYLDILVNGEVRRIGVTRIHIEEDAGKLIHDDQSGGTLADYNRCGVPLIEIVSEPDLRSADEAKAYMESIAEILLYLGISEAKMEQGNMRADVNVSVRPRGQAEYGTRAEMKNVNSFSAVHRAVLYEANRQIEILSKGGTVEQETRRWDDVKGKSTLMRTKEDAQDYRYFPDPDLLTFVIPAEKVEELKVAVPELPLAKTQRYMQEFGLSEYDATLLAGQKQRATFFDAAAAYNLCEPKAIANWLLGDILKVLNDNKQELEDTALTPKNLAEMIELIEKGTVSGTAGKKVLDTILEKDIAPAEVVKQKGLAQISDTSALTAVVDTVLAKNPKAVEDYKGGKTNVLAFIIGQCMKESRGQGNPAILKEMVEKALQKL
ncbi:Asp-tRNA(Asn)/Glu-tRNA(Gln) amidotransferase subunit GatB [Ruminococcaceae bacterium OttesenSCG-928-A16]|nr:Asp-tRNA(Asn)/Glu-tRNA(Gln) amidotransferase subunit GatB [Ruminococcaceae bacterium OttesenSCG-928-A16]